MSNHQLGPSRDVPVNELFADLDSRMAKMERMVQHLVEVSGPSVDRGGAWPAAAYPPEPAPRNVDERVVVPGKAEIQVERILDERGEYLALSHELENIAAHWRDLVLTPSRSEAMLFAILPALNVILQQVATSACDDCIKLSPAVTRALRSWGETTVAERVALSDLFDWVAHEMTQGLDSVIPPVVRSNIEASRSQEGGC